VCRIQEDCTVKAKWYKFNQMVGVGSRRRRRRIQKETPKTTLAIP
jgi:hypothetical protein